MIAYLKLGFRTNRTLNCFEIAYKKTAYMARFNSTDNLQF